MSTDAIRIDDSAWPVVIVEPMRVPSADDVAHFVNKLDQIAAQRRTSFAVLLDARGRVKVPGPLQKRIASGFKQGAIAQYARAEAVLLHSALLAALGRLALKVIRPKFRMGAFGDYNEAFAWARAQAEAPAP